MTEVTIFLIPRAFKNYALLFQTLTITDDIVKKYRNYVIMYVLYDAIKEIGPCM